MLEKRQPTVLRVNLAAKTKAEEKKKNFAICWRFHYESFRRKNCKAHSIKQLKPGFQNSVHLFKQTIIDNAYKVKSIWGDEISQRQCLKLRKIPKHIKFHYKTESQLKFVNILELSLETSSTWAPRWRFTHLFKFLSDLSNCSSGPNFWTRGRHLEHQCTSFLSHKLFSYSQLPLIF